MKACFQINNTHLQPKFLKSNPDRLYYANLCLRKSVIDIRNRKYLDADIHLGHAEHLLDSYPTLDHYLSEGSEIKNAKTRFERIKSLLSKKISK